MSKFVFTPELTKEDAQRIIDALNFQFQHKTYSSQVNKLAEKLRNKELIKKLRKVAKVSEPTIAEMQTF